MKYLIIFMTMVFLFCSGCATISHKNIQTDWQGYGVSVKYKSEVAINPDDIPSFINAVDKLERLLNDIE